MVSSSYAQSGTCFKDVVRVTAAFHRLNLRDRKVRQVLCCLHNSYLPLPPKFVSSPHAAHFWDLTNRSMFAQTPVFMILMTPQKVRNN